MESRADRRIGSALCHQVEYFAFALSQLLDGIPVAASSNELRNYVWVDDCASGCDPSHGIAEFGDVANVILQYVSDAAPAGNQLHYMMCIDVLGEDENADRGQVFPYLARRGAPFSRVSRRHPDVEHHDVGRIGAHQLHQRPRIADLGHDIEAEVPRHANKALAEKGRVVNDRQSQGISARRCVPAPLGLEIDSLPPTAAVRSSRPCSPPPLVAPPTPSSRTSIRRQLLDRVTDTFTVEARACLAALASASDTM